MSRYSAIYVYSHANTSFKARSVLPLLFSMALCLPQASTEFGDNALSVAKMLESETMLQLLTELTVSPDSRRSNKSAH